MDDFGLELAEILEVEEVRSSDVLADFPDWDSLSILSVVVMIERKYGVTLGALDVRQAQTAEDLHQLVLQRSATVAR